MCSAQIASAADFATTLFLVNLCGLYYVSATFVGALAGGIVNCCINYKWGLLRVVVEESYRSQIPDGVGRQHISQYGRYLSPYRRHDAHGLGRPAQRLCLGESLPAPENHRGTSCLVFLELSVAAKICLSRLSLRPLHIIVQTLKTYTIEFLLCIIAIICNSLSIGLSIRW